MYEITWNGMQVGKARVEKDGLYYKITCVCTFDDTDIHRVIVSDGESFVKLGVCIPEGDQFYLTTKVPVKSLRGNKLSFMIKSNCTTGIPVISGKPFAHLERLETARLQIKNGQAYIFTN